jgi:hypothetical protein
MSARPHTKRYRRLLPVAALVFLVLSLPAQATEYPGIGEFVMLGGMILVEVILALSLLIACAFGAFRRRTGFQIGITFAGVGAGMAVLGALNSGELDGGEVLVRGVLLLAVLNLLLPALQYGVSSWLRARAAAKAAAVESDYRAPTDVDSE